MRGAPPAQRHVPAISQLPRAVVQFQSCKSSSSLRIGMLQRRQFALGLSVPCPRIAHKSYNPSMTGMPKSKFVEPDTKFGNFTFLRYTVNFNGNMKGLFSCAFCGEERERLVSHVRTGYVKTCHCQNSARNTRHGHAADGRETPTYQAWAAMKKRCLNPDHRNYAGYGGRGIDVCQRWMEFENFLSDMGNRPDGMSLDRINNDAGYSPENCRWATAIDQNNNRRSNTLITFDDKTFTVSQWARELGMKKNALIERFRHGWSVERAFTTPVQKRISHENLPPASS